MSRFLKVGKKIKGSSKLLSLLMVFALVFLFIAVISTAYAAPEDEGPPGISITKKEVGADGMSLGDNTRIIVNEFASSSTTMGNTDPYNNPANNYYFVANKHFTYVKMDVEAVKAAPNGVDYDLVFGDKFTFCGKANVRINDEDQIVFTLNNYDSNGNWGLIAQNDQFEYGKNPHSGPGFSHNLNVSSTTIPLPEGYDKFVYLYFHNENTMKIYEYSEVANTFEFQIRRVISSSPGYEPVSITEENIIFRSAKDGAYISDGGGLIKNGNEGEFWLKPNITATIGGLSPGQYEIVETKTSTHIATVNAPSKDEGGNIVASITINDKGISEITFTNQIIQYELEVKKEVIDGTGNADPDDEFGVKVVFTEPSPGTFLNLITNNKGFTTSDNGKTWTGTLKAGETVVFSNIPKDTTYKVTETSMPVSYDPGDHEILEGVINFPTDSSGPEQVAKLVNKYVLTAELTLSAEKAVDPFDAPTPWSFNFALYKSDAAGIQGDPVGAIKTATNIYPTVTFDKIGIREPGTYYYLIKETSLSGSGWKIDQTQYLIKFVVETGLSYETSIAKYSASTDSWGAYTNYGEAIPVVSFTNEFTPGAAKLTLSGKKTMNIGVPTATFNFSVTDDDPSSPTYNTKVGEGRVRSNYTANIEFSTILLDTVGDYIFKVSEDTTTLPPGWTSNTPPKTIYVRVTKASSGTELVATAYSDAGYSIPFIGSAPLTSFLTFDNTFEAKGTDTTIGFTKSVEAVSGTLPATWLFEFELYESNSNGEQGDIVGYSTSGSQKIATHDDPTVSFDSVPVKMAGPNFYLIKELTNSGDGWTKDNALYLIQITTEADEDAILTIKDTQFRRWDGTRWSAWAPFTSSSIAFKNTYKEPSPGTASVTLSGIKEVTTTGGVTAPSTEFTFKLFRVDGGAEKEVGSITIPGKGTFAFDELIFNEAGTYEYIVKEVSPGGNWKNVAPIKVIVKVTGAGTLDATVFEEDGTTSFTPEYLTFENEYNGADPIFDLSLTKRVTAVNENPASGTPTVKIGDKITYTITVKNEGQRAGFVEEIVDRIPNGLEFDPDDPLNTDWTYEGLLRSAFTSQLNTTLLQPGDTAIVTIVLIVSEDARKGSSLRNTAEINWHSDEERKWIEDDDSVPGNNVPTEDDQDDATVRVAEDPPPPGPPETPYVPPTTITPLDDEDDGDDEEEEEIVETEVIREELDENDEYLEENNYDDNTVETVTQWEPGGDNPAIPPLPTVEGNTIVPGDEEGIFIEFDEDGVPLGEWHYDDDLDMWLFDPYPPLAGALPQTSGAIRVSGLLSLGCLLIGCGFALKSKYEFIPKKLKK